MDILNLQLPVNYYFFLVLRMNMTLLLVNDLIHEAFNFQRHHIAVRNELLEQFFKGIYTRFYCILF